MNSSRIPSLFLFVLLSVFFGLTTRAQLVTNTKALEQASRQRYQRETDLQKTLLIKAREKGWPLTLRNKKGRLAYLRGIDDKGLPIYITTTDNIVSAATIRTTSLWPGGASGLSLNGASLGTGKIAVWDEGLARPTHVELTGRVTQVDGATNLSDHSTHVAGTLIAAGVNPLAKGMAFGAKLSTYDFNHDESEMTTAASHLLVSSHSYADIAGWFFNDAQNRWEFWGQPGDTVDIKFGLYDADAQTWDDIAYNAPNYLIVKAGGNNRTETGPAVGQPYYRFGTGGTQINSGNRPAGISNNDSYNTIATYGCAKNILTMGAVYPIPGGYNKPSDVVMAEFSSWGPTGDGRIKPDLVADGINVLSSVSSADNAYDIFSGTSMATPAAAGSSLLLQEYYNNLHAKVLRSATIKGLMIHTADEAGPNPGPDYQFGWGLINMQRAASVITSDNGDHSQQIIESSLTNGSKDNETFIVTASGKAPLVATICWTDPAGTPATIPSGSHNFQDVGIKLVNDLDLRIKDNVTGKVFMPWVLNPANRPAAATKGDNIRDNVEKVELGDTVVPGHTYTITVSHKGSIASPGTQAYSLFISGVGGTAYCSSASSDAGGTVIGNVTVSNTNNNNTVSPACKTYSDFTGGIAATKLPVGQAVPISISFHSCGAATTTNIAVYIDFNNNGTFDAGELVTQNTGAVLNSGTSSSTFNGTINVPSTVAVGTSTLMRIVAQDNGSLATPAACGNYTSGETQDYRVVFTNPPIDAGITALEYPTLTACASDSQIVAIRIHNFGTSGLNSVPVTTVIKSGATTIATLTAVCKDTIPPGSEVVFTYNTPFLTTAGTTYTLTSTSAAVGDPNTGNDQNVTNVTINAGSSTVTGAATICGTNATSVVLKANATGIDVPVWYETATSSTPLAAGTLTSSTVITPNKTYYVALNDLKAKAGVPNKLAFTSNGNNNGQYFRLGGNYMKFSTSVPITIESARLYAAHSGQVSFTLAIIANINKVTGQYSYQPLYTATIDLHPTKQVPTTANGVAVGNTDNTDTGAIYYLNIPVPTPGNYAIMMECSDSTSLFINTNSKTKTYPLSLPDVFTITGNDHSDFGVSDSAAIYYALYNIGIRLNGCPGPRTAVVATTAQSPVVTLNGNVASSSAATGNHWYLNDSLLDATGQTDTLRFPGVYYTIVDDPVTGCSLMSNKVTFTPSGGDDNTRIGLTTSPNPSSGVFQLQFFMTTPDNTSIVLINTLGQRVYQADYPGFSGLFSQQIAVGNLASGIYILKIIRSDKTYKKQLLIRH